MSRVGRDERARLHEAASTLAGIRAATTLLSSSGAIGEERRAAMTAMVQSELERLERMVRRQQDVATPVVPEPRSDELRASDMRAEVIDLDSVVATMVLAHEARGTEVVWRPSRMLALGDSDQLTEALNVLLDNAAAHGSGSVRIEVRAAEPASTSVEIAVTDDGPGVAPELRRRIFAWGVSRPGSTGQGIGLHAARDLMERQGGYLELLEASERTTFVLGIPMLGCADGGAGDGADRHDTPTQGGRHGVAA
ncbi:Histidine kinase-, DNA gyrase B-, and HSP90-like ATPase [Nocardioides sp. YR527]|uniref:sensor histidine kinase n=1 Tax=Nocardioides sp. YR527 TaxID=1881028 RepID=UPI00088F4271|nr:ATP-binding protein [Nocardioides sp. YR527]SDK97193.1 Histidine kinase-, DNA gyrase B-, and HSP90-like ATPase [Nocardioides sp. YR527]